MGPYVGGDYNSSYLIVNSEPTAKKDGYGRFWDKRQGTEQTPNTVLKGPVPLAGGHEQLTSNSVRFKPAFAEDE